MLVTKLTKEDVAKICHEANRGYCQGIGDDSQVAWEDAPGWQKESAMLGVELHTSNHEAGPKASHESWMAQKVADGWKYGPVKDAEKKEHPCIVPFDDLPVEQQAKDFIFRAVAISAVSLLEESRPVETLTVKGHASRCVRYAGQRKHYRDGLYGTGDWEQGQVKEVPAAVYPKMLRHPDVYVDGTDVATGETVLVVDGEPAKDKEAEEEETQNARDAISAMSTKEAIADYALVNFGQKIPRTMTVENMKQQAVMLIDQYGAS